METKIKIEMINENDVSLMPKFAHKDDACLDIFAAEDVIIYPPLTVMVKSGFRIELQRGWEAQIRPRSGNSLKKGFHVVLGTIDAGYTGEVGIIVSCTGTQAVKIRKGDKIAQMAIREVPEVRVEMGHINRNTERGSNAFGSTDQR